MIATVPVNSPTTTPEYKMFIAAIRLAISDLNNRKHQRSARAFFRSPWSPFWEYCALMGVSQVIAQNIATHALTGGKVGNHPCR